MRKFHKAGKGGKSSNATQPVDREGKGQTPCQNCGEPNCPGCN